MTKEKLNIEKQETQNKKNLREFADVSRKKEEISTSANYNFTDVGEDGQNNLLNLSALEKTYRPFLSASFLGKGV